MVHILDKQKKIYETCFIQVLTCKVNKKLDDDSPFLCIARSGTKAWSDKSCEFRWPLQTPPSIIHNTHNIIKQVMQWYHCVHLRLSGEWHSYNKRKRHSDTSLLHSYNFTQHVRLNITTIRHGRLPYGSYHSFYSLYPVLHCLLRTIWYISRIAFMNNHPWKIFWSM